MNATSPQEDHLKLMGFKDKIEQLVFANGQITAVLTHDKAGTVMAVLSLDRDVVAKSYETGIVHHTVSGEVVPFTLSTVAPGGEACGDGLHLSAHDQPQTISYTFAIEEMRANPDGDLLQFVVTFEGNPWTVSFATRVTIGKWFDYDPAYALH